MNKTPFTIDENIETTVHELLDSRAESRIYIYLLHKNRARSEEIIRGTKLHPSTVRELLSKMYNDKTIYRKKIKTETIGKKPYLYSAVSPVILLRRRVKIVETRLNTILNLTSKTKGNKRVQITIDHQAVES